MLLFLNDVIFNLLKKGQRLINTEFTGYKKRGNVPVKGGGGEGGGHLSAVWV